MSEEDKRLNKIQKAIIWAEGIKRHEDTFTASTNNAADVILFAFEKDESKPNTNNKDK